MSTLCLPTAEGVTERRIDFPVAISGLHREQPSLDREQVQAHPEQDDQEHHPRDRGAHHRVAQLELEPEEGSEEEGAEEVAAEVRSGESALDRVDQVERIEVTDEGQH